MKTEVIRAFTSWANVGRLRKSPVATAADDDKKRELVQIQWFVVIACCYLLIVQDGQLAQDPLSLFLLSLPLGSMAVLTRLPESALSHRWFPSIVAVVDAVLFSIAIFHNRQSPWDLCLIFFFGILISAIGENLLQIIVGSLMVGIISVLIIPVSSNSSIAIDANTLLRIPLIFGASLVYGHLSDQVKREKKRTAQSEDMRRQQLSTKDRFLSHVSHELRTPLTAIYQFVTILSDGLAGDLNDQQREYLEVVQRNVKQLQAMVGDLLDAARTDDGKLTIDPRVISLQASVHEVLTNHRATAAIKSITLSSDIPDNSAAVYADSQRVKQILANLIGNAMKFTATLGEITVKAQPLESNRGLVRITVTDSGCGISQEAVQRIFERLYQEESMLDSNRNGLGLGLHICRELVSRQGGTIWVESEIGKGSAFHFTLPAFSLRRLLVPFVEQTGGFATGLAIISVKVEADGRIEASEIGKAVWKEKWTRLEKVTLPTGALLLPRMTIEGEPERFFVLSAGNVATAESLARRIEKEVGGSHRTYDAQYGVKVSVLVVQLPEPEGSAAIEVLTGELSRQILNLAGLSNLQINKVHIPSVHLGKESSCATEPSPVSITNDA
jgi:signal transduction histidine kinase